MIAGTLAVWLEVICARRVFDEASDVQRFRAAFRTLMERESRWPSPSKFLEALPSNVVPFHSRPKLDSDEIRQRGLRHIKEINKIIGYHPRGRDDDPEPPKAA